MSKELLKDSNAFNDKSVSMACKLLGIYLQSIGKEELDISSIRHWHINEYEEKNGSR